MELKAFAKINLSIDVLKRREDNYHEVRMIMQSIGLYDTINFDLREKGIKIYCTDPNVPCDERNIVYKVLQLLKENYKIEKGMEIDIHKRIPVAAGLAGGSCDAACAIIAASSLWDLKMTYEDMVDIGSKVGADVPFCIKGGTALAEGIGDKLTQLPSLEGIHIVLAKPLIGVSTKEVYQSLKIDEIVIRPDIDRLLKAVQEKNIRYIADNMVNVLETVTIKKHPVIEEIKRIMVEFNALGSLMSGSGPTVFGIFDTHDDAEKCYNRLRDYIKDVYIVESVGEL
ncbi:4-diphosphocytidyl-2-C-methyl-D-erythritol kinase [Oxobacter pfennigii]|uniref:4-diphosphocytidyl-2-C-methyl-D-erythritol kinase n=1 Tax=Oxobacter pfennigii TaxID=36849 RepID=A0A0P8W9A9_9CLOT|nr:4-(cytidine 5'-diphospho)-2-C-methyl-D-erythritol kinase [Oxobacter pfennigii]KPU44574.1 4-diphosphocytidyl-2-C-methyl-D-erythritol kinase [Oxobacter pfennigii]